MNQSFIILSMKGKEKRDKNNIFFKWLDFNHSD